MNSTLSQDERLLAALAHGSVVVNGLGIIVGTVIWLTQREMSAYAAGQGLQAAVYQLLGMIVIVGLWVGWGILYAISMIPLVRNPEQFEAAPPTIFWVGMAAMVVPLALMVIWGAYGLWGALQCWRGQDFRYAFLGSRLNLS